MNTKKKRQGDNDPASNPQHMVSIISYQTFSEDKKVFILDLNMNVLSGVQSEIHSQMKQRLDEIQILASRIYNPKMWGLGKKVTDPFVGLTDSLKSEVIAVTYYKKKKGKYRKTKQFVNKWVLKERKLPKNFADKMNKKFPLWCEPARNMRKKSIPVAHMFKHLH